MSTKKTLGGDRLGAGKKMKVSLHGYERSTHDMGYLWRSTMAAGTLVPFLSELALPGDTFDIGLNADIKTHPTEGPLFGSYKVQLDVFQAPIRLYQGKLHNNKLGIGMDMASVALPQLELYATPVVTNTHPDVDNAQINPSCILSYLGIRGVGMIDSGIIIEQPRLFNAIPYLSYWDIYKNYYANKQEEIGYVIHRDDNVINKTIDKIQVTTWFNNIPHTTTLPELPIEDNMAVTNGSLITITYIGAQPPLDFLLFQMLDTQDIVASSALDVLSDNGTTIIGRWKTINGILLSWRYDNDQLGQIKPRLVSFPLTDIDKMREIILGMTNNPIAVNITDVSNVSNVQPYKMLLKKMSNGLMSYLGTQEGLGIKTYQSDLFNNWLSTEWIDGPNGINEITAIDTTGGSINLDTILLSKKVYDMLNRIAVSGGSYDDWLDAVYDHNRYTRAESPIYHGGLIKELVFQEVISNSQSTSPNEQPLGTLGGRGVLAKKHKGGHMTIRVDEPSYIIGIISLTPRIDYSQGNKWDTHLKTMDDLHKPALDEIGFQDLITEQMAWWTTKQLAGTSTWEQKSAGKQPAWINYMTNVNQTRGNFAIKNNEMFMTLNRRYEPSETDIKDLTTYIDPAKYNNSFAVTSLDAQNFWAQIAVDMTVRRKISAKVMPNL